MYRCRAGSALSRPLDVIHIAIDSVRVLCVLVPVLGVSQAKEVSLSPTEIAVFLGVQLLRGCGHGMGVSASDFMRQWKDTVPTGVAVELTWLKVCNTLT